MCYFLDKCQFFKWYTVSQPSIDRWMALKCSLRELLTKWSFQQNFWSDKDTYLSIYREQNMILTWGWALLTATRDESLYSSTSMILINMQFKKFMQFALLCIVTTMTKMCRNNPYYLKNVQCSQSRWHCDVTAYSVPFIQIRFYCVSWLFDRFAL